MDGNENGFLGGRIRAHQPKAGFRSGTDAVMLAAAIPAASGDHILELGSGAGIASLCLAVRVPECRIVGIEIAAELAELATKNARANHLGQRVRFQTADAFCIPKELRREFNHVLCNPPFHDSSGESSPEADRARALSDRAGLGNWVTAGFTRVVSGGTLTMVLRADRLGDAIAAAPRHGLIIFPLWPRAHEPAKRVLVQIRKNSRAPLRLLPGLVLHDGEGRYTREAEAILRDGTSLALANPRL